MKNRKHKTFKKLPIPLLLLSSNKYFIKNKFHKALERCTNSFYIPFDIMSLYYKNKSTFVQIPSFTVMFVTHLAVKCIQGGNKGIEWINEHITLLPLPFTSRLPPM